MQKIFINNITLILKKEILQSENKSFDIKDLKKKSFSGFLKKAAAGKWGNEIEIYGLPDDEILTYFEQNLTLIVAGGGLVQNSNDKILFIFRNGKWDLPKGKTENDESIEQTAIREVEEECGLSGLSILSPLPSTYHIYSIPTGEFILKKSIWFHMRVENEERLVLQKEEGITDARWMKMPVDARILDHAYLSIKELISYFQNS
jgi:8-oxo-dGTP pyrophosphatase MutT (NUDIX family)